MTWVKLDDGFAEHPKVISLSDHAFRCYVEAVCWSARNLTDGQLASGVLNRIGQDAVEELAEAGLLDGSDQGWSIHDYLVYNPTHEDVLAEREEKHEAKVRAGKAGAAARWHADSRTDSRTDSSDDGSAIAEPMANAWQNDGPVPVPQPVPTTPTRTKTKELSPDSRDSFFEEFWQVYPRREGKLAAHKAFKAVPPMTDFLAVIEGARRFRDDPNREAEFTPHPATWLNQGRWDDDPLPARTNGHKPRRDRAQEIAQQAAELAKEGL